MVEKAEPDVIAKGIDLQGNPIATALAEAAEKYGADNIEAHMEAITKTWEGLLREQTRQYGKQFAAATAKIKEAQKGGTEVAEPISTVGGVPYQWWNLLLAGPFQFGVPFGPYRPTKIIAANEASFVIVALWRNPFPLAGGPSAASVMAAFSYRVRLETINLSSVTNGPDFQQPLAANPPAQFGGGFVNFHTFVFPGGTFGTPLQGAPHLFELNATVDVVPAAGAPALPVGLPPFAGYSTWVLDPDREPPFWFPYMPGVGYVYIPNVGPGLQHDTPCRFLVYR